MKQAQRTGHDKEVRPKKIKLEPADATNAPEPSKATEAAAPPEVCIDGRNYNTKECLMEALATNDTFKPAWVRLACYGGGRVGTKYYTPQQCCEKVLEMYPCCAMSWVSLGNCKGGRVQGKYYNAQECYLKAFELDFHSPSNNVWCDPWLWFKLGDLGGGKILETVYTSKMCYEKALEIDPKSNSLAWYVLCFEGGAQVHGKQYTVSQCTLQAFSALPFSQTYISSKGKMVFKPYLQIQEVLKNFKPKTEHLVAPAKNHSQMWESHFWVIFGAMGGGEIDNKNYTREDCIKKAIEIFPTPSAWYVMACLLSKN